MLENTSLAHYWHLDLYLARLERQQQARGFVQYSVFAGYGHRVSMSTTKQDGGVQRFGGCFLPPSPHLRPLGKAEKDNYIFKHSPPGMRDWVEACTEELGRTPKRGDVVVSKLELELPAADASTDQGQASWRWTW